MTTTVNARPARPGGQTRRTRVENGPPSSPTRHHLIIYVTAPQQPPRLNPAANSKRPTRAETIRLLAANRRIPPSEAQLHNEQSPVPRKQQHQQPHPTTVRIRSQPPPQPAQLAVESTYNSLRDYAPPRPSPAKQSTFAFTCSSLSAQRAAFQPHHHVTAPRRHHPDPFFLAHSMEAATARHGVGDGIVWRRAAI